MSGDEERNLLDDLRRGEADALRSLYLLCQPRLYAYLARLSGCRETAQDLCSEVWCRAAAKLHTLRPDSRLLPWLFAIGRNLFFSYCRWRSCDEHYLNELGRLQVRAAPQASPPEAAMLLERKTALEAALDKLPGIYREAVILVGIAELDHNQAAQVTGVRPAAFRKRFSRGLNMLRERLADMGGGNGGGKDE